MNVTGFVVESIVPVRIVPKHKAEMVTQVLFGDLLRLVERQGEWYKIRAFDDEYEGWVAETMLEPISDSFLSAQDKFKFVADFTAPVNVKRGGQDSQITLVKGARFPVIPFRENDHELYLKLGTTEFRIEERFLIDPLPATIDAMALTAKAYLNAPYLWGGKTPFGLDCSGYMQMLFRQHGVKLPRDSYQQVQEGRRVSFSERQAGDVAFFTEGSNRISHVGFLLERDTIIHGSGRVRIDQLTEEGILNSETNKLTHDFAQLRRVL